MKILVNARNCAHHFKAASGEKILFAGLQQAIGLPYECASGTCGTCKARLLSGEISDPWPDAPGAKFLKSRDEFLMCQCEARSDVTVEVASFVSTVDTGTFVPAARLARIERTELLTHDVMRLVVTTRTPMEFDAGQFVLLRMPGVDGYRAWSMANYDRSAASFTFIIKRKPGGAISERLFAAPCGGVEVELFGPLGSATFYPTIDKDLLCIAGGSGIAGMMSILHRAAQDGYFAAHRGDVFFGVRTAADSFLLDELSGLAADCGEQLQITVALSHEPMPAALAADYPRLRFETGFVHEVAGRHMQGRYQNMRAYLAGPPPAVDASIRMLLQARVSTDNIRYDKFS
jgi:toluene monooxygenase electron transfer component